MRAHRLIIGLLVLAAWGCKPSQPATSVGSSYQEDLSVHRPELPKVSDQVAEQVELNREPPAGHLKSEMDSVSQWIVQRNAQPRTEDGFTIQLYSGLSREEANRVIAEFAILFPEMKTRMEYKQPDFKVKAGTFTDRIAAYESYGRVKGSFPQALLIPDKIKFNE